MCAVIGVVLKSPSNEDFELVTKIFLESKIRGLHATGLSYVKNDKIITEKYPIPADQFKFDFPNYLNEDGNLYLIGHCRYSTSDLQFNQPISNDNFSIAHNGVITQELPEHWEELFGYKCSTKNDTELLLHTLEEDKSSLHVWNNSSLAVCELHKDKTLRFYRNGKRPLCYMPYKDGYLITSTNDILDRAGILGSNNLIESNIYYSIKDFTLNHTTTNINDIDLQKAY